MSVLSTEGALCLPGGHHQKGFSPSKPRLTVVAVIYQANGEDQPRVTLIPAHVSCSHFLRPAPRLCPRRCLWFSQAVRGTALWHRPLHIQFCSTCACSGSPGLAQLSLWASSFPPLFIDIRTLTKWSHIRQVTFLLEKVTKREIYRFKTTCQIHWCLFQIFIYQRGLIEDLRSRVLSPRKHRFPILTDSNLILWIKLCAIL